MRDKRVPIDISCEVLSYCREIGVAVRLFLPDAVVMSQEPAPDEAFFKYRSFERVDTSIAETLEIEPMQLVIVHRDDIRAFTQKFAGTHVETDLHWLLTGRDPETPHYWALHLLNKGGTKSQAVAQLCEERGVAQADVLAFGDGINDVDMLAWAGTGVTFPWGVREALAVADMVTSADDPHPIASVIYPWLDGTLATQPRVA
jgi:hydroxymethylpyrimidine pyrophosphatase-like HAD family hydrolase